MPLHGILNIKGAKSFTSADYRQQACGYVIVNSAAGASVQTGTLNFGDLFPTDDNLVADAQNPIELALTELRSWNAGLPTTLRTAISSGASVSTIPVPALAHDIPATTVTVTAATGGHTQTFTTPGAASGANTVPVTTTAATSPGFAVGATVVFATTQQRLKLRIGAGIHCPSWMKSNTYGGTFQIIDPTGDTAHGALGTCPQFWTKAFQDLFYSLMQTLATKYDPEPLIATIVASPNMTFYCEPCLRQTGAPNQQKATSDPYTDGSGKFLNPNGPNMLAGGYRTGDASTPYTDVWNQNQYQVLMKPMWLNTVISSDFNPYQVLDIKNPLTTSTGMTHNSASPTSFTVPALPTGCAVAINDDIMIRDNLGQSQIFQASAISLVGATTIHVTSQTVSLQTQSTYQIYSVQAGSDVTQLKWPMTIDDSNPTIVGQLIAAAYAANPWMSGENDSFRKAYVSSTQDITAMYVLMNSTFASTGSIGVQTAQGPNIDGGTVPTTAVMQTVMSAMATGSSVKSPLASHVEMYPAWSQTVGGVTTQEPDYTGPLSVAQVKAIVDAMPAPNIPQTTYGFTGTLPPGMAINASTGVLSGTPTGSPNSYTYHPTATNANQTIVGPATTIVVSGTGTSTLTKTQPAVARVAVKGTKTQTGRARIHSTVTATQPAVATIAALGSTTRTATQPAKTRVAITATKTQPATARIAVTGFSVNTKTQTAIATIVAATPQTMKRTMFIRVRNGGNWVWARLVVGLT